jgi:SAM-dependent methyltransferase
VASTAAAIITSDRRPKGLRTNGNYRIDGAPHPYDPAVTEPEHVTTTRALYDAAAETYRAFAGTEVGPATEGAVDRALLAAFVELTGGRGPVADLGCGPGRVAAFLAARGLDVIGVDLSPEMVGMARSAHPGIRFEEGELAALPFPDASLAAAVCWYSVIHTPPDSLDAVCAELRRVVVPGGQVLVAFQAGGGDRIDRQEAHGTLLPLTNYRHDPDDVARRLEAAGLPVRARVVREPELAHEVTPQAFLLARA